MAQLKKLLGQCLVFRDFANYQTTSQDEVRHGPTDSIDVVIAMKRLLPREVGPAPEKRNWCAFQRIPGRNRGVIAACVTILASSSGSIAHRGGDGHMTGKLACARLREQKRIQLFSSRSDGRFVAPVKYPLFNFFRRDQSRIDKQTHVLAQRRGSQAQLFRDAQAADPVGLQIAIDLWRKMQERILQPFQHLKALAICQNLEQPFLVHFGNLPSSGLESSLRHRAAAFGSGRRVP